MGVSIFTLVLTFLMSGFSLSDDMANIIIIESHNYAPLLCTLKQGRGLFAG